MVSKKILILSRKYPPSVGGMQVFAQSFIRRMKEVYKVDKIVLGREKAHLAWFLPYLFVKSVFRTMSRKYDLIWLCDGLLAPIGVILKKMLGVKVGITVHGLDVTYKNPMYQFLVPRSIGALDRVVCVSSNTIKECVRRGIKKEKCSLITNGVEPDEYTPGSAWVDHTEGKKALVTVGRLVKRKGIDWFISDVMPRLSNDYIYLVVGDGPEKRNIWKTIRDSGMAGRVKLLGRISDDDVKRLYNSSYAMVMPNRRIDGDPEGFGIVAIEAASSGLPVVASSVDGISEAVLDGKTGWLVAEGQADIFADKIKDHSFDREIMRKENQIFSWDNIIKKYQEVIDKMTNDKIQMTNE